MGEPAGLGYVSLGPANVVGAEKGLVLPSLTRWCIVANLGLSVREKRLELLCPPDVP